MKKSPKRCQLLCYFTAGESAREVFDKTNALLDNVDLQIRTELSEKLRAERTYSLAVYRAEGVWERMGRILNCIRLNMELREKVSLESLADVLTTPPRHIYASCWLSEDILRWETDDDEEYPEDIEDADEAFGDYEFPKISRKDFERFSVPQKSIPEAWQKSAAFRRLVRELPEMRNYRGMLRLKYSGCEHIDEVRDRALRFARIVAAALKERGRREAAERLVAVWIRLADEIEEGWWECHDMVEEQVAKDVEAEFSRAVETLRTAMRYESLGSLADELAKN